MSSRGTASSSWSCSGAPARAGSPSCSGRERSRWIGRAAVWACPMPPRHGFGGFPAGSRERELLVAFGDGVNARIAELGSTRLPFEYHLLGRRPAGWEPVHSLHLLGRMGWTLALSDLEDLQAAGRESGRRRGRRSALPPEQPHSGTHPAQRAAGAPYDGSRIPGLRRLPPARRCGRRRRRAAGRCPSPTRSAPTTGRSPPGAPPTATPCSPAIRTWSSPSPRSGTRPTSWCAIPSTCTGSPFPGRRAS